MEGGSARYEQRRSTIGLPAPCPTPTPMSKPVHDQLALAGLALTRWGIAKCARTHEDMGLSVSIIPSRVYVRLSPAMAASWCTGVCGCRPERRARGHSHQRATVDDTAYPVPS